MSYLLGSSGLGALAISLGLGGGQAAPVVVAAPAVCLHAEDAATGSIKIADATMGMVALSAAATGSIKLTGGTTGAIEIFEARTWAIKISDEGC